MALLCQVAERPPSPIIQSRSHWNCAHKVEPFCLRTDKACMQFSSKIARRKAGSEKIVLAFSNVQRLRQDSSTVYAKGALISVIISSFPNSNSLSGGEDLVKAQLLFGNRRRDAVSQLSHRQRQMCESGSRRRDHMLWSAEMRRWQERTILRTLLRFVVVVATFNIVELNTSVASSVAGCFNGVRSASS